LATGVFSAAAALVAHFRVVRGLRATVGLAAGLLFVIFIFVLTFLALERAPLGRLQNWAHIVHFRRPIVNGAFHKILDWAVSRIDNGGGVWYHFAHFSGCCRAWCDGG
jgi:hypothetical protein